MSNDSTGAADVADAAHAANSSLLARLEALEIKATYAEDLLDTLNLTLYRQQQTITALAQELQALRQQRPEDAPSGARNLREELPPHY